MADNFTQFSELLEVRSPEQEAWLTRALQSVLLVDGKTIVELDQLTSQDQDGGEECPRFVAEAVIDGQWEDLDLLERGFDVSFEGHEGRRALWIWNGGDGHDPFSAAALVQRFLAHFQISEPWMLTYSTTCSKPHIGEFSGGAIFVTAQVIESFSPDEWLLQKKREHAARSGKSSAAVTDR